MFKIIVLSCLHVICTQEVSLLDYYDLKLCKEEAHTELLIIQDRRVLQTDQSVAVLCVEVVWPYIPDYTYILREEILKVSH